MLYSELINSWHLTPGTVEANAPREWRQGRSVFGGLQVAIALGVMRTLVPDMPIRSLQATLMSPLNGETLKAVATVLRQSKNTVHVEARLMEGEQTLGIVIGVFGVGRPSAVQRLPVQPAVECAQPIKMPYVEGLSATFSRYFEATWLRGNIPFTGDKSNESVIALSMKDEGLTTEYHVVAIADYSPPVAISQLTRPVFGATMTWMLEFLTENLTGLALDGWRIDTEMMAAKDGYTNQSLVIWGPGGVPIALSRQTMVIFG